MKKEEVKEALENFAEAFLQHLHESGEEATEALQAYELALLADIHKNPERFKNQFANGYFALMANSSER